MNNLVAKLGEKPPKNGTGPLPGLDKVMLGVLALLAADRDERAEGAPARRTELVLAEAGFDAKEIGALTGKNAEAVRSLLRRQEDKKKAKK